MNFAEKMILYSVRRGNALSRTVSTGMATYYVPTCYEELKKRVMRSSDCCSLWSESEGGNEESFVGFVQFVSDKTATTSNATSLVA